MKAGKARSVQVKVYIVGPSAEIDPMDPGAGLWQRRSLQTFRMAIRPGSLFVIGSGSIHLCNTKVSCLKDLTEQVSRILMKLGWKTWLYFLLLFNEV